MAKPIELPGMNHRWYGAEGSDIEPLPVFLTGNQSTSVWKLEPQELASVLATGCIGVSCFGRQQPICVTPMTIEQPPEQPPFLLSYSTGFGQATVEFATLPEALAAILDAFAEGSTLIQLETKE